MTARFIFWALITAAACSVSAYAHAAQVRAIKGNRVLIDLQNDQFNVGDILKAEDSSGKTIALAKVTKLNGKLAEGIFKGNLDKGTVLKLRPAGDKTARSSGGGSSRRQGMSKATYGGTIGFNSASATVKLPAGNDISMSGTGLSLLGLMDYPLLEWVTFRGQAGLEQLNLAEGSNNAKINYLAFDFLARFSKSSILGGNLWGGAGIDIMFPASKSSNAIDSSSISNIMTYVIAGGYNLHLSGGDSYIPIQVEYQLYPSSADVKASAIEFRAGYAKHW